MQIKALHFSVLSPRRQQLVKLCTVLNFGTLDGIALQSGEPLLDAATVIIDERLDLAEEPRPEIGLADFKLSQEWCRLLGRFDEMQSGVIERLEVRAGVPRRALFRMPIADESNVMTGLTPDAGGYQLPARGVEQPLE
jgi:hypothetical protein